MATYTFRPDQVDVDYGVSQVDDTRRSMKASHEPGQRRRLVVGLVALGAIVTFSLATVTSCVHFDSKATHVTEPRHGLSRMLEGETACVPQNFDKMEDFLTCIVETGQMECEQTTTTTIACTFSVIEQVPESTEPPTRRRLSLILPRELEEVCNVKDYPDVFALFKCFNENGIVPEGCVVTSTETSPSVMTTVTCVQAFPTEEPTIETKEESSPPAAREESTDTPSQSPTTKPTDSPTVTPTASPTQSPTTSLAPTQSPAPSLSPTLSPKPTYSTEVPTAARSEAVTEADP